jgi:hypothetical protein
MVFILGIDICSFIDQDLDEVGVLWGGSFVNDLDVSLLVDSESTQLRLINENFLQQFIIVHKHCALQLVYYTRIGINTRLHPLEIILDNWLCFGEIIEVLNFNILQIVWLSRFFLFADVPSLCVLEFLPDFKALGGLRLGKWLLSMIALAWLVRVLRVAATHLFWSIIYYS